MQQPFIPSLKHGCAALEAILSRRWRPTLMRPDGSMRIEVTPFGGRRLVLSGGFSGLAERVTDGGDGRRKSSRFLGFAHALRNQGFYLAHYVAFKLRHPRSRFVPMDVVELAERFEQSRVKRTDKGAS